MHSAFCHRHCIHICPSFSLLSPENNSKLHTHTRTHARTHARTHTHTHTPNGIQQAKTDKKFVSSHFAFGVLRYFPLALGVACQLFALYGQSPYSKTRISFVFRLNPVSRQCPQSDCYSLKMAKTWYRKKEIMTSFIKGKAWIRS